MISAGISASFFFLFLKSGHSFHFLNCNYVMQCELMMTSLLMLDTVFISALVSLYSVAW